jgi:beta-lactam-binding protein with PASTA domain
MGLLRRSFVVNLVVVLLLCFVLYVLFFASLKCITRHGQEVKIPSVTGQNLKDAMKQLDAMSFDVYVDSAYEPQQKPFTVLKQMPDVGSTVKTGRTVFLTVNRTVPPGTPMPNLVSLSYRSAEMILKNNKLLVGDTTYRPDIAAGAILQQLYNGKDIKPGEMIPQGSKISLVIGDGLGVTEFNVPDVTGSTFDVGSATLSGNGLQYTVVWDAPITDSSSAVIYDQTPKAMNDLGTPNKIKAGDVVDIRIKQTADVPDNSGNNTGTQPAPPPPPAPKQSNNNNTPRKQNNTNSNSNVNSPSNEYN